MGRRADARIAAIRAVRDGSIKSQGETHRNRRGRARRRSDPPASRGIGPLARHLAPAIAANGAIPDRCASRVLESALLLALLRATDTHAPEQKQLEAYLRGRRAGADPIDALLIDACLDPAASPPSRPTSCRSSSAAGPPAGDA